MRSSSVKKLLIDGGFEVHKVSVVLAPDYTGEELKGFVLILKKKEVLKLERYNDFGDHVELHGMKT